MLDLLLEIVRRQPEKPEKLVLRGPVRPTVPMGAVVVVGTYKQRREDVAVMCEPGYGIGTSPWVRRWNTRTGALSKRASKAKMIRLATEQDVLRLMVTRAAAEPASNAAAESRANEGGG